MNLANEITDRVNMLDVFSRYGFNPDRKGFINCPFHSEKTASLGIYADNKRFKCFGCGAGGSVIDFVMKLFNLDFRAAMIRINADFGLNLLNTPTLTRHRQNEAYFAKITAQREKERRQQEENEAVYWDAFTRYRVWSVVAEILMPKSTAEEWSDAYCYAVRILPILEYIMDSTEV